MRTIKGAITMFVAAVLIPFVGFGQQVELSSSDGLIGLNRTIEASNGDQIVLGSFQHNGGERASVTRVSFLTGDAVWSTRFVDMSRIHDAVLHPGSTANGDHVVFVGYTNKLLGAQSVPMGFVGKLNVSTGAILWNIKLEHEEISFSGVDVDPDGNIYIAGTRSLYGVQFSNREFVTKLDPDGNVLWARVLNDTEFGVLQRIFFRDGKLYVVGRTSSLNTNNNDISVSELNPSTGAVLSRRVFGHFDGELLLDAVANNRNMYVSYLIPGSGIVFVANINLTTLQLEGVPTAVRPAMGNGSFSVGRLLLKGGKLYVAGQIVSLIIGRGSVIVSMTRSTMTIDWARVVHYEPSWNQNPSVRALSSFNSHVVVVDQLGLDAAMTTLTTSGDVVPGFGYCSQPLNTDFIHYESFVYESSIPSSSTIVTLVEDGSSDHTPVIPLVDVCAPTPLPITLISFDGRKDGETSLLSWQTASERNGSHFVILRSEDGLDWKEIGTVDAVGNSQQLLSYEFVDSDPLTGNNFYKLESVDLDDSSEQSDIVAIHFDRAYDLSVYPNPVTAGQSVNVKGEFLTVEAYDQMGRQVPIQRNGNQLVVQAGPGVYLLSFFGYNGSMTTTRVVVQ